MSPLLLLLLLLLLQVLSYKRLLSPPYVRSTCGTTRWLTSRHGSTVAA